MSNVRMDVLFKIPLKITFFKFSKNFFWVKILLPKSVKIIKSINNFPSVSLKIRFYAKKVSNNPEASFKIFTSLQILFKTAVEYEKQEYIFLVKIEFGRLASGNCPSLFCCLMSSFEKPLKCFLLTKPFLNRLRFHGCKKDCKIEIRIN